MNFTCSVFGEASTRLYNFGQKTKMDWDYGYHVDAAIRVLVIAPVVAAVAISPMATLVTMSIVGTAGIGGMMTSKETTS